MFRKADIILTIALIITGLGLSYFFTAGSEFGESVSISVNKEMVAEYSLLEDRTLVIQDGKITSSSDGTTSSETTASNEDTAKATSAGTAKLHDYNIISIKDGQVTISEADCPGGDCTRQGPISRTGETIVCLPHKVMIEITGGKKEYDTVSR